MSEVLGKQMEGAVSHRWRTALAGAVVLASAGSLTACGSSASHASAAKAPYTVGVLADLTGSDASFGSDVLKGVEGGFKIVNEQGGVNGHPVQVTTCDTQSTASGASLCGSKLVSGNSFVITAANVGYLKAALPAMGGHLVLVNSPLLNPPRTSNAFQVGPPIKAIPGEVLTEARQSGLQRVGVVATNDATGTTQVQYMQANAGSLTIVPQFVPTNTTDVTAAIDALTGSHVQIIYVAALGTAAAATVRAYHELGTTVPLVLTGGDVNGTFLQSIAAYEPSPLYGVPDEAATVPGDLPAPFASRDATYFSEFRKATGSQPDATIVAAEYTVSAAVALLQHFGPNGSLSAMESYLHQTTIDSLTNINFNDPALNVATGIDPGFVTIQGTTIGAFRGKL
jgi:branched-chain amino acid transport system substrate-binding protein